MTCSLFKLLFLLGLGHIKICLALLGSERSVVIGLGDVRESYDYVIIGGGTSGLTVANRLTEDPEINVLSIEYGQVDGRDGGTSVPGLPMPQKYFRNYQSTPQLGLNGRTSTVYSGSVVGGGTVVNGMFFNRGSKADYDAWEKLGNPGWGWKDLEPYFKKATTFTPPPKHLAEQYPISSSLQPHGRDGPVSASFSNFQYPIIKNFFRAWNSIGIASNPQPNAGFPNGAFYSTVSLKPKNQSRDSASTAFYRPYIAKRPNWHLLPNNAVTKVGFDDDMRAACVHFASRASMAGHVVNARKEIILAAGAVHSPQILQLSGVGPRKLLSRHGIETLVDLPGVGHNFQDQPSFYFSVNFTKYHASSPNLLMSDKAYADRELAAYYQNRTGPYTIPVGSGSTVCFLALQNVTDNPSRFISHARSVNLSNLYPDIDPSILRGYKAQQEIILDLYASPDVTVQETAFNGGSLVPIAILKPLSRGSISINSSDPSAAPVFDYGTFRHPSDLDVAVAAVNKNREFYRSPPMQEIGATEVIPAKHVKGDEAIKRVLRNQASSTWSHPSCALPMMRRDYGGVVDAQLRVYGTKGLRIVDASVFPLIPATHTSWPVYAVAEKAADLIKAAKDGCNEG